MSLMVSISGIRGIVGETLTPAVASRYAAGFAAYLRERTSRAPEVVVGWDGRVTGDWVSRLVTSTLIASGVHVREIGIVPTPTVQLAVELGKADGGISVTASHNPVQWNGLKFIASSGMFLDGEENRAFWALADGEPTFAPWNGIGKRTEDDSWIGRHIAAVLGLPALRPDVIRRRKFRVVVDCVNACGGRIVPPLLRELGCDVTEMNCEVSGVFAHTPEPIPENLTDLAARVRTERADLGIAVDPDGDRLVLITETGEPFSEENTVAAAVRFVLGREAEAGRASGHTVVVNLSTTRAVDDIAHHHGAKTVRTPVGEINVAKRMKELNAIVGGEGSGGVILPAVHLGRDASVGIGLLLQLLAESQGTLSALKSSLPQYAIAKGKIAIQGIAPSEALELVRAAHAAEGRITTDDGLKIDFPESWVHLRKSNTEPIIRIIAEARSMSEAQALVKRFTDEIASFRRS